MNHPDPLQAAKDRTLEMLDDAIHVLPKTAFPVHDHGEPMDDGMTLRDYFAAHAPAEPWPHFNAVLPPKPTQPSIDPVGNDGEAPTPDQENNLRAWRGDPCWNPREEPGYESFTYWCDAWDRYWGAIGEWERNQWIERAEQWPWFYADAMLKRRGA